VIAPSLAVIREPDVRVLEFSEWVLVLRGIHGNGVVFFLLLILLVLIRGRLRLLLADHVRGRSGPHLIEARLRLVCVQPHQVDVVVEVLPILDLRDLHPSFLKDFYWHFSLLVEKHVDGVLL